MAQGRQLDQLNLAWATTVHKAQGGESKVVVLVLSQTHWPLLSRRLLYTGTLLPLLFSCRVLIFMPRPCCSLHIHPNSSMAPVRRCQCTRMRHYYALDQAFQPDVFRLP